MVTSGNSLYWPSPLFSFCAKLALTRAARHGLCDAPEGGSDILEQAVVKEERVLEASEGGDQSRKPLDEFRGFMNGKHSSVNLSQFSQHGGFK